MMRYLWPLIVWLPLLLGSAPVPQAAPTEPIVALAYTQLMHIFQRRVA